MLSVTLCLFSEIFYDISKSLAKISKKIIIMLYGYTQKGVDYDCYEKYNFLRQTDRPCASKTVPL